jgi:DNA-binding GntR family transcriptional regulator
MADPGVTLYEQLADEMTQAMRAGLLRVGERLY